MKKHEEYPTSMGTFSVRNLRADKQNVAMKHARAFPSLARFLACYLITCVAVYLYFRYYLTNDKDYGTPPPAAVIHENLFRPLNGFPPSADQVSPNELFEKLQSKYRAGKRPGNLDSLNGFVWHKSEEGFVTKLGDPALKKSYKLQPPSMNTQKGVASALTSAVTSDFYFAKHSNTSGQNETLSNIKENNTRVEGNSTRDHANISSIMTQKADNNKFDLNLVQVISNSKTEQSLPISHQFHDFRRQWFRQRRSRVDWRSSVKPCVENMAWGQVNDGWGKLNRSSAIASDVAFWDIRPAGEFSKVFIQSRTSDNRTKTIGGDSWRVYVRGPSSVAATVFDHNNGTYEALFLIMEPGVYQLMIYLDYSLCDGFKDPPRDWFTKGNAQGKYQKDGLLGTLDDYLKQPLKNGSPLIITVPESQLNISLTDKLLSEGLDSCAHTCNHLWDGFGRWVNNKWRPYLKESYNWSLPVNYKPLGVLWIYGDSVAVRFTQSVKSRFLCKKLYLGCQHSYNWIYPIINEAVSKEEDDNLDFRPGRVIETILHVLRRPEMQRNDSVLILNLGLHFPIGVNFTTFQKLIGEVIKRLKETEVNSQGIRVPKYKAKVIWKSTTAIHKENAKVKNTTNWRFFTTQRVQLFNAYAMSAMCKAGFDVIDVFPLTDSYPEAIVDEVHYPNEVFNAVETMLEKYKVHHNMRVNNNAKRMTIKRCIS